MYDHPEYVQYAHQYGYKSQNPVATVRPASPVKGALHVMGGKVAVRAYRPLRQKRTPRLDHAFDIDCTSSEASLYWEFLLDLLRWAVTGYPRDRLARDLHFAQRG